MGIRVCSMKGFLFMIGGILGSVTYSFWCEGEVILDILILISLVVGVFLFFKRKRRTVSDILICLVWLFSGCALMIGRYFLSEIIPVNDIRYLNGGEVVAFDACISGEVDVREGKVKYTVNEVCLFNGLEGGDVGAYWSVDVDDGENSDGKIGGGSAVSACTMLEGKVLIDANKYPLFEYGDVLRVSGNLSAPESLPDFAYDKYLAKDDIYSVMSRPKIEKVAGKNCGSVFMKLIYEIKGIFEDKLSKIFPEPYSSFAAALLLGSRRGLPDELVENFKETGLTHVVAISGYNITLVIIVVWGLFGFLSRKKRVVVAASFITIFVVLVGAGSSVLRAGIMGCISLFAIYFGRKANVINLVLLSAFLMSLWNPKVVVYDVGFQLSFLATLGLIYISPKLSAAGGFFGRFLKRIPVIFAIRENFSMTLSAQVFTMPVILKNFGRFSFICPLANIFVLPFIPFLMLFSFFAVLFGFFSDGLSNVFAFACYVLMKVVFFFVEFFADLSRFL